MDENRLSGIDEVATNAAAGLVAGREYAEREHELLGQVRTYLDGRPYRVRRDGSIEIMEGLAEQPTFRRGSASFYDAASFSAFVNRFKNGTSLLFADALGAKFTGVLDYHPAGEENVGQWDQFRAEFPMRFTPSWTRWATANKTPMPQADFALFLEEQIPDIAAPAGALIVEIARTLEANTHVQYQSHIRADNGAHKFVYDEEVTGSAKRGELTIPPEFLLVLQPFEGSNRYEVAARLRYRITSKTLMMWFDLVRIEDVLKQAFADEEEKIKQAIAETPILHGPAPAAQVPAK